MTLARIIQGIALTLLLIGALFFAWCAWHDVNLPTRDDE